MRRFTFIAIAAVCVLITSSVLVAQSPQLTPFRGLIDHVTTNVWGGPAYDTSDGGVRSISGDGRYVVFSSRDSGLVADDFNWNDDVFLRDRTTGLTTRLSVNEYGGDGDGISQMAAISTNGRHVAFASGSSNLVSGDSNNHWDVFVRDLDANRTVRISVATDGSQGDADAYAPSLSADGRYVTFISSSTTFAPNITQYGPTQIYLHDRDADANGVFDDAAGTATSLISIGIDLEPADQGGVRAHVSADGRYVMFESSATNLDPVGNPNWSHHVYLRDRQTGQTTLIDRAVTGGPSAWGINYQTSDMSDDGRFITYSSVSHDIDPFDMNWISQVFLYDAAAQPSPTNTVISRTSNGTLADGSSYYTTVSGDGRFVGFTTAATNLAGTLGDNQFGLVVRDTTEGTVTRIDVLDGGIPFDGEFLSNPSLSADGTAIAFQSDALNAVQGSGYPYGQHHIFVATALSASPTSASFVQAGGSGSIVVETSAASGWTAASENDWIVVMDGDGFGAGPRTVQYLVSDNPEGIVRNGRIRLGSTFVAIHQEGDGDTTPPVITPIVTGTQVNGWYTSDITVQFEVSDPDSEIVSQIYNCSQTLTFTTDFIYAAPACEATSHGGTASVTVPLRRDTTPPNVWFADPKPAIYPFGSVVVPSYSCYDASQTEVTCTGPSMVDTWTRGRNLFSITATDEAGHTATKSVEYLVGLDQCVSMPAAPANLKRWLKFDGDLRDSISGLDAAGNFLSFGFQPGVAGQGWFNTDPWTHLWAQDAPSALAGPSGLTIALWAKSHGWHLFSPLVQYQTLVFNPMQYHVVRWNDGTLRYAFNTTNGFTWVNTGVYIWQQAWQHIAITYNDGVVQTFLNGSLAHSQALSGTLTTGPNTAGLQIGGRNGLNNSFKGVLDDVMIFDAALPASDLDNLALSGSGSLCAPFGSNLTLTAPPTVTASGPYFQVTALLTDADGRPIPNRPLTITSAVSPPAFVQHVTTDASGSVSTTFPVTSQIAGGVYEDAIVATFDGDDGFVAASAQSDITVIGTPPLSWLQPANITYGAPLGPDQLRATSALPGTFEYSPAEGTVLDAGVHMLSVTFTPTDTYYAARTLQTMLLVLNATPTVEISSAQPFYTGQPQQATVTVRGIGGVELSPFTVLYNGSTTPPTNAGTYALQVQYAGNTNYAPVTTTGSFVVRKATPTVEISTAPVWYTGYARTATVFVRGINSVELYPYTVLYNGSTTAPINAGTYPLEVQFAGNSNYEPVTATGSFVIRKNFPIFPTMYNTGVTYDGQPHGGANVTVIGVMNEHLTPIIYTYNGSTTVPTNADVYTVVVRYDGSANYEADSRTFTHTIFQASPQLTWGIPTFLTYGQPLGPNQLKATANLPGTFTYTPPAGTILPAGDHLLTATFTPADTNYKVVSTTRWGLVLKANPSLSWANQADIVYGTALSATQLNATANTAGTFVYNPPAGTVLAAGLRLLSVVFTPDDLANYNNNGANLGVWVNVTKATPVVSWDGPADIVYGTALSAAQLNATASVAGTFSYSPAASTVLGAGAQTLSATFTPADAANYSTTTSSVTLNVAKAASTISWASPADIVYGAALGAAQLNATANVAGTFSYSPAAGVVLNTGSQALSVTFTPNDAANYNGASANVTLTVNRAASTISWPNPADIVYGATLGVSQLNATASVAGSFSYSPAAGTALSAGSHTLSVTFTPDDAANYNGASANVALAVTKAVPTIEWANPADVVYGTALGSQLNATANVAGTLSYSPAAGTVLNAGSQTLSVTFTPDDAANYHDASASVTLNVTKAASSITWANPADVVYGAALGSQLNATANVGGTFSYSPVAGTVLNAGSHTLSVTFTPDDAANYNGASASVAVNVTKAASSITWAHPADIVYGTTLGAAQLNATGSVAGTFNYTPGAGTVLNAGSHTLSVTFTPDDAANYNGASANVTVNVTKAASSITWANPADIVYGTALGSQLNATANVAGTFSYSPAAGTVLAAGSYTLSVTFTPADGANHDGSSTTRPLTVARKPLTVAASDASKVFGAPLPSFAASGAGFVNGDSMASLTGTLGFTTPATASSAVGSYPITASGLSSPNYTLAFVNGTLTVVRASTATAVAASPNPNGLNQEVTFTAVVSVVAPGAGMPTGIVQFFDGATLLGSALIADGSASLTTNGLTAGSHSISATYAGDVGFAPSSGSNSLTVKTAAQSSTTAVTSSVNPSNTGQTVTFTATVTAPAGLSGSVAFYDGSTLLATRTLSGTTATFSTTALANGGHAITARYLGNATIPPSTSTALAQYVKPSGSTTRTSTTTVTASPSPATLGGNVTLTATVTGSNNKIPTGQVLFMVNGTVIGQATVSPIGGLQARTTLSTSSLARGTHKVQAVYLGDTVVRASAATQISLVVN